MLDKEKIKSNFSKCARYYDSYCNIQNRCALDLIGRLEAKKFNNILDIGCGTGNYTGLLRERFPEAKIKALDISPEMLDLAREKFRNAEIDFIAADGEKINLRERFDLISSNAAFQWFEDLEKALNEYEKMLKAGGMILFSIFGPDTFRELEDSIKEISGGKTISSADFKEKTALNEMMKKIFRNAEVEEAVYRERYGSLAELLEKIKYSGTRGNGADKKSLWTPKAFNKLEALYKRRFNDITATYQIFFCRGIK